MPELFYCGNQWGYTPVGKALNIPPGFCDPPTNLTTSVYNQFVTFSWTAPHDYLKFVLEYRISGSGDPWTVVDVYGVNVVIELAGNTLYSWRVKTVCELVPLRESLYALGVDVGTGDFVAGCAAIGTATITNMGKFYRLSWTPTANAQFYVVQLRIMNKDFDSSPLTFYTSNAYYDFTDLRPGVQYEARVGAVCALANNDMPLVWSPWVPFEAAVTDCLTPVKPNFTVSATSIIVTWALPPALDTSYRRTFNIYLDDVLVAERYPINSFTFTGLTEQTKYNIKIRTNCDKGFSDPLSLDIVTGKALCPDPTALVIDTVTDTGFTLNWVPAPGVVSQEVVINNGTPIPLAAGVTTYPVTGLPAGSRANVLVRSVCATSKSYGLPSTQQLTGCPAVTGLVVTPQLNGFDIKWDSVANAYHYRLKITKVVGTVLVYDSYVITNNVTVGNLLADTSYLIEVTTGCGVPGSEITYSGITDDTLSTLVAPACESAVIDSSTIGQTTYDVTFSFASGRTTGFIRAEVRKVSDNSLVQGFDLTTIGTVNFTGLTFGTQYKILIYHKDPDSDCVPAEITTFTTTGQCRPPTSLVLTMPSAGGNLVDLSLAGVASPDAPPNYSAEYMYEDGAWISAGVFATFPATIAAAIPNGRYKVRVRSNCPASAGDWVETNWTCPVPLVTVVAVQGNKLSLSWEPLIGISNYLIEINSLVGGQQTYSTTTNFIEITGLPWSTTFYGFVKAICDAGVPTYGTSLQFPFSTGKALGSGEDELCPPTKFTAFIQDCLLTDPKEDDRDDETGGGGGGGVEEDPTSVCGVTPQDWNLINSLFIPITTDPPNDTFFEGTFSIPQAVEDGEAAAMPGGILGIINSLCLPGSSATMDLEILQGGTLNVGNGTLATNGNITVTGTYVSDGSTTLIIRLKGNYNKV